MDLLMGGVIMPKDPKVDKLLASITEKMGGRVIVCKNECNEKKSTMEKMVPNKGTPFRGLAKSLWQMLKWE